MKEPIWLICDTSKSGVGAMYSQGPTWQNCRPAGFMSKKFTTAQQNYAVHELETLAILEALMKWEDKLIGYDVHIITDHKALEFFKTQSSMTAHQRRGMDYLSRFNFDITYIKSDLNKVANCLSHYYESDNTQDVHMYNEYVRADPCIDPAGEDLPAQRCKEISECIIEMQAMRETDHQRSTHLREWKEQRDVEAEEMALADRPDPPPSPAETPIPNAHAPAPMRENGMTLADMLYGRPNNTKPDNMEDNAFKQRIRLGYNDDKLLSLIIEKPMDYPTFTVRDNLIWKQNIRGDDVLCLLRDRELLLGIVTQAHESVGHFGSQRTDEYIRWWYWWPYSTKEI